MTHQHMHSSLLLFLLWQRVIIMYLRCAIYSLSRAACQLAGSELISLSGSLCRNTTHRQAFFCVRAFL
ncbi:Protein PAT1 like 1 [Dissostichus eleginoides]|uniref:Protein PAT1 like 1 n=1 Tax=Dissostichus eleginoides TaxID=100907 RepID=A0AAD9BYR8_DISEL|nr:Protein PAT1 like 1 [Dissostichus eleginoides]